MNKTLNVDSFKIIGLNAHYAHYVLVPKDTNIYKATLDNKTYDVEFERTLTLDSAIENRLGFSDKVAIENIEKSGSYGFATKIETTISVG